MIGDRGSVLVITVLDVFKSRVSLSMVINVVRVSPEIELSDTTSHDGQTAGSFFLLKSVQSSAIRTRRIKSLS